MNGSDTYRDSLSFLLGATVAMQQQDGGKWIHGVIVEVNSTDHNGWSYIVRVMKMGRIITYNTRHICKTLLSVKQYLWEQIKKWTGHLKVIFTEARSDKHNMIFSPYAAGTQVKLCNSDRQVKEAQPGRSKGLMPGEICWIVIRTVTLKLTHPRL